MMDEDMYVFPSHSETQYDELLSQYNKIKEEIKDIGSEKDIDIEI